MSRFARTHAFSEYVNPTCRLLLLLLVVGRRLDLSQLGRTALEVGVLEYAFYWSVEVGVFEYMHSKGLDYSKDR